MPVVAIGVKAEPVPVGLLVIYGHQKQVYVRLLPDRVMRQTSAKNDGENRAILLDLFDKRI